MRKEEREPESPWWAPASKKFSKEAAGGGWGSSAGGQSGGQGKVRVQSGEPSVLLPEEISAIQCGGLDLGRRKVHGGPAGGWKPSAMSTSRQQTPKRPSQGGRGEGWGQEGRDAGGASSQVSQAQGRNGPRTSPEGRPPSSRGPQGGQEPEVESSGRAGPGAEWKWAQASWCQGEAVRPGTCLPGLQRKDLSRWTEDLGSVCLSV